jgi:hypothetical protein
LRWQGTAGNVLSRHVCGDMSESPSSWSKVDQSDV